ncbi:hypothetical protein FisN_5Hh096 [Fistulifera solaris]|uniref:Fe2OG dioxygenase domain-containing protein n=1 Tax=Fistulifera solaris TaxID=1519565 RepID=A0A1Z5JUJ5_FISSO|nr:hypothetical protein FisN_5Hh096 [Fistulifera solaris]|eukprot:GAX17448.1 hypothetical protein FisN_5Hh096 [Fistulifera solaris]
MITVDEGTIQELRDVGLSLIDIPSSASIPAKAFSSAQQTFQNPHNLPLIPHDADSAHVTGYHPAGGSMSRYNLFREGFVWSDEGRMNSIDHSSDFAVTTRPLEDLLHLVAQSVLRAMEQHLHLPLNWFETTMGPTRHCSQWHLKRFVATNEDPSQKQSHWLPAHTDPSLISIVIHDRTDVQEGGYGLEYRNSALSKWVSVLQSGHAVAIVMIGSVLSQITGQYFPACRHRVLQQPGERMAATLFLRPVLTARLHVPPSPLLQQINEKHSSIMTFEQWSRRVAQNYQNGKSHQKKKNQRTSEPLVVSPETDLRHYHDEHTNLALLSCYPPLRGAEKYLGGESGQNGKIYVIPGHATQVLCIDPTVEPPILTLIGPEFQGKYKWLRSVQFPSGIIIGIPCHASSLLRIDPHTESISTLTWDHSDPLAPDPNLQWKWHGGQISPIDGCLYCIPQRAESVLKFDPVTEQVSFLGGPFPGRNKWYGGLLGRNDGAIYAIHQCHSSVLKIDPSDQTCSLHGDFPTGGYKWHGGVVAPNGVIYGIPSHADRVLKVIPGLQPKIHTIGGVLRSGSHRTDGKYKYLGGAVGADGKVYFFPSDSDFVLQVDPSTDTCREVGPNLRDIEKSHNNKWQNGFTASDGTIYGIPLKGNSVLRIRTRGDGSEPEVSVVGGPFPGLNHWEGGVMGADGAMFCMPLNRDQVLRIRHIPSN